MDERAKARLAEARDALRQGRRDRAREILLELVEEDERIPEAWLLLSGLLDDLEDVEVALENVLALEPDHPQARSGLEWVRTQLARARESEARPEEDLLDQTFLCQHCGAEVFVSLANCLSCGNAIHSCVNCARRAETECKRQQGIWGPAAEKGRNRCPWWTPAGTGA